MSRPSKHKNFKELQAKWYAKLAKTGFDDIEDPKAPDGQFVKHSVHVDFLRFNTPEQILERQEYYRLAGQFLYDYAFSSSTEKFIWEKHANAVPVRDIALLLGKRGVSVRKTTVHSIIQRLAKQLGKRVGGGER